MKGKFLFVCSVLLSSLLFTYSAAAGDMDELFRARRWKDIDRMVLSADVSTSSVPSSAELAIVLSPREWSLAANALWFQGRWAEALQIFQRHREDLSPEVRPYADMLTVLGLERTGRKKEAGAKAMALCGSAPSNELKYYAAYAVARLVESSEEKRKWFERMKVLAGENTDLRRKALKGLMSLPDPGVENSLALLRIDPLNDVALSVIERQPQSPAGLLSLGYAAYLEGNHERAVSLLERVSFDGPIGKKASYYRAFSLKNLGRYDQALSLWKRLALRVNGDYSSASIRGIYLLRNRLDADVALDVLCRIADEQEGYSRAMAIYYCSRMVEEPKRRAVEDRLLRAFPDSGYSGRILWKRGWNSWKSGRVEEALRSWKRGLMLSERSPRSPGLLYWSGRCYERLGRSDEAAKSFEKLAASDPVGIYAFLAFPGGAKKIDDVLDEDLRGQASLLERWGFVAHARIRLLRDGSPSARYRAARLASWMGDDVAAFQTVRSLAWRLNRGKTLSRLLLKLLYPRPYRRTVLECARRFNVEPCLVWAVMRQESSFNPLATSSVGARGLMQLMPATARDEARRLKLENYSLYSPSINITLGVSHLAYLFGSFRRIEHVVAAYNAGGGSVRRWNGDGADEPLDEWMEDIPYDETRKYVRRVMANLFVYRSLYGDDSESVLSAECN